MGRPRKIENLFKPIPSRKSASSLRPGGVGYDNPRENIDPHVRTKVVSSKEADIQEGRFNLVTSDEADIDEGRFKQIKINTGGSQDIGMSGAVLISGDLDALVVAVAFNFTPVLKNKGVMFNIAPSVDGGTSIDLFKFRPTGDSTINQTFTGMVLENPTNLGASKVHLFTAIKSSVAIVPALTGTQFYYGYYYNETPAHTGTGTVTYNHILINGLGLNLGGGSKTIEGIKFTGFATSIAMTSHHTIIADGGNMALKTDSGAWFFGAGEDWKLYFNGTTMIMEAIVGTADFDLDCGSNKTLRLVEEVWDDQQVNLGTVKKGSSAPNEIDYHEGYAFEFVNAQSNEIRFNMQLSHKYKLSTDIEFHIHTAPQNNTGGNVRWQLKVSLADINSNFNNTATFLSTQTIAANSQDDHLLHSISADIGSFAGLSGVLLCNLTRLGSDGLDTLTADINLVALDSHTQLDTIGSRQEDTK